MSVTDIVRTAGNVQGAIGTVGNFVNSIASLIEGDVVGIFDSETYTQIFSTARPMKASVAPSIKVMDHPIESGSIKSDFAITLPLEIELSILLQGDEYRDVYESIKTYFTTRTTVVVQLRTTTATDMLIQGMPFEENPDMFDVVPMSLKLRQVQTFNVQYQALASTDVATSTDQSTVSRGAQQTQSSTLYDIVNYLKGIF